MTAVLPASVVDVLRTALQSAGAGQGEPGVPVILNRKLTGPVDLRGIAFLDIETTGTNPLVDKIVEIAIVRYNPDGSTSEYASLVNPGIPIPATASAIHHITDDMVADAPALEVIIPEIAEFIEGFLPASHNANFDASFVNPVLGKDPVEHGWLCTWRLARHLFPEAPAHSNQVLRYWLKTSPQSAGLGAHRAIDDVYVSLENLKHLADQYKVVSGVPFTLEGFKAKSDALVPMPIMTWGKHEGEALSAIPVGYLNWLLREKMIPDELGRIDRDLKYAVDHEMFQRGAGPAPVDSKGIALPVAPSAPAAPAAPAVPLTVSFADKEEAKALGARWNGELKKWMAPGGMDLTPFAKWLPPGTVLTPQVAILAPAAAPVPVEFAPAEVASEPAAAPRRRFGA